MNQKSFTKLITCKFLWFFKTLCIHFNRIKLFYQNYFNWLQYWIVLNSSIYTVCFSMFIKHSSIKLPNFICNCFHNSWEKSFKVATIVVCFLRLQMYMFHLLHLHFSCRKDVFPFPQLLRILEAYPVIFSFLSLFKQRWISEKYSTLLLCYVDINWN